MREYYSISGKVIAVLALVISQIMVINEDGSVKIVLGILVVSVAVATACFTRPISDRLIKIGDGISNDCLKVLYYVAILPLTLLVAYILYGLIMLASIGKVATLGDAIIVLLIIVTMVVTVIVPYIQTLIVLVVRRVRKVDEIDKK